MPRPNDKLYLYNVDGWNTPTFLEEGIAPGARTPTYLVRSNGRQSRVPTTMFCTTRVEALERYLTECKAGGNARRGRMAEDKQQLSELALEIARIEDMLLLERANTHG